ncbi:MAG: HAMP domain-containing histidine kinase [Saprospiraceae bacterium]|nr:HAMP domain-containing histidine kinase [Saprospiraceae bacterium]MDW8484889.1 HAMP domain-containing sensor histidine kinase [Saprospiraceae bacterium]
MKPKRSSLQWLTTAVLTYMVLAFAWWAIELWRQNDRLLAASVQVLVQKYRRDSLNLDSDALRETAEYQVLLDRHRRHRRMILSEGIFFTLCLMFGLWVINRAARREVALARQRRNFLLSITHELKSPVAAMRLALETMARRALNREQIEQICSNGMRDAARLQTLVDDLLLAARLEDNWQPQPEPVDVSAVIQDCVANAKVRFPKACVEVEIPANFPPIQADRLGLTSVVQNLLDNALKYSPPDAPVRISVTPLPGRQMRLTVADQGVGIPDAEKSAIFEKFYRIGNEETRQTTGTGLGLYIVSQIVRLHGGSISVCDNYPRGTVFVVEL